MGVFNWIKAAVLCSACLLSSPATAFPWWERDLSANNWSLTALGSYNSHLFGDYRSWSKMYGLGGAYGLADWGGAGLWFGRGSIGERAVNPGIPWRFKGSQGLAGGGTAWVDFARIPAWNATVVFQLDVDLCGSEGRVQETFDTGEKVVEIFTDLRYDWLETTGLGLLRFAGDKYRFVLGIGGLYFREKQRRWELYESAGDTVKQSAANTVFVDKLRPVLMGGVIYELPERYFVSAELWRTSDFSFRAGLGQRFKLESGEHGEVVSRFLSPKTAIVDRLVSLPAALTPGSKTFRLDVDAVRGQANRGVWGSIWFYFLDRDKRWFGLFPADMYLPQIMIGVDNMGARIENRDGAWYPGEEYSYSLFVAEDLSNLYTSPLLENVEVQVGFGNGKYLARRGFARNLKGLAFGVRKGMGVPGKRVWLALEWERDGFDVGVSANLAPFVDLTAGRIGIGGGKPYWMLRSGFGFGTKLNL